MNNILMGLAVGGGLIAFALIYKFIFMKFKVDKIVLSIIAPVLSLLIAKFLWMTPIEFLYQKITNNTGGLEKYNDPLALVFRGSAFLAILAILLLLNKFLLKFTLKELGFHRKFLKKYLLGCLIGISLVGVAIIILVLTNSVKFTLNNLATTIVPLIISLFIYMVQSMVEEIEFRGLLVTAAKKRFNIVVAIILSGIWFLVMHMQNPGIETIGYINIALAGFTLAVIYAKTGSIWLVAGIHAMVNFMEGPFFGSLVSGNQ